MIGYARTSTLDQKNGLEVQLDQLREAGCEKVFEEQVSSVDVSARERLAEALDYVREGDVLVVSRLDRLARSVPHLLEILDRLTSKGTSLRVLGMGIDTGTPTGKLMLTVLSIPEQNWPVDRWNSPQRPGSGGRLGARAPK